MFTLIRNYRALFMMCIAKNLEMGNLRSADTDNDGVLTGTEFNNLTDEQKVQIQRDLGPDNMKAFVEAAKIKFEEKEAAQDAVRQNAGFEQDSTSRDVENASGVLSPNKVRGAENYYLAGNLSQENENNLIIIMEQKGLSYNGTLANFAQNIATIQRELGVTVDGKAGPGTINALNAQTNARINEREASSSKQNTDTVSRGVETASMRIEYPPQGREATIALQKLIGTTADGAFGPASRRALQVFLQKKGLYTGTIDGDIGRGSRAAIAAYNGGASIGSTETNLNVTSDTSRARGREAMNSRDLREVNAFVDALDEVLDAGDLSNRNLRSLVQNISSMSATGKLDNNVWNSFKSTAGSLGWSEFVAQVDAANFTDAQKFDFLTRGFEENTMGGTRMAEQLQPGNSIASISTFEQNNRDLNKMAQILSGETGIPVINIINARQSWLNQAGSSSFSSRNFTEGEIWSTRSQGITDITGIRSFRSHQIISLPGRKDYVDMNLQVPELINNMSEYSLNDIKDGLGAVRNRVSIDEIRQALLSGEPIVEGNTTLTLTYDVGFFKSADCFNDAVGIIPKVVTTTERREKEDDNGSSTKIETETTGDPVRTEVETETTGDVANVDAGKSSNSSAENNTDTTNSNNENAAPEDSHEAANTVVDSTNTSTTTSEDTGAPTR